MGRVHERLKQAIRWGLAGLVLASGVVGAFPAQAAPPAQTGTLIHYGDAVSGEITDDVSCLYYWFNGTAGDPISIDMTRTSGSLDGVLSLYLRDGSHFKAQPVAANDDRPDGGLDPLITFRLPKTDWYSIAACRVQHEGMRITTGTFTLTLTGPAVPPAGETPGGPTPTEVMSLTAGLFPAAGETASPVPSPTPEATADIFSALGSTPTPGGLPPAPQVTPMVSDSPTPAANGAANPEENGSGNEASGGGAGGSIDPLANPCRSGAKAITGPASSDRLSSVYTAAGSSYSPADLTPAATFRADDDLNVVFNVQNASEKFNVAGVFCAPGGQYYDGGSGDYPDGGPYLLGLDWKAAAVHWETGHWYAEIYVDGTLDLTLGFEVR